jgi:hypothetical protein
MAYWGYAKAVTRAKLMRLIRRSVFIILAIAILFSLANLFDFWRYGRCFDCEIELGIPFPFWRSGGYATAPRFLWPGLMQDFAFVLVITVAAVSVWSCFGARVSK